MKTDRRSVHGFEVLKPGFGGRYYTFLITLGIICVVCVMGIYILVTKEIGMGEEGTPATREERILLGTAFGLVGSTWLGSYFVLLAERFRGAPFEYDGTGFRNTLTGGIFFSLVLVAPVRYIPDEAILYITKEPRTGYVAHLDRSLCEGSWLAKKLLFRGWDFCRSLSDMTGDEYRAMVSRYRFEKDENFGTGSDGPTL